MAAPPAPDFSLAVSPTGLPLNAGSSASVSLLATGINGFTSRISVRLASVPSGCHRKAQRLPAGKSAQIISNSGLGIGRLPRSELPHFQARASSTGLTGTIRATRCMTFLFCSDFFRSCAACNRIHTSGELPNRRATFRHMTADRGFRPARMS
jgi:hypothetical protein